MKRAVTGAKCQTQMSHDVGGSALAVCLLAACDFGSGKGTWGQAAALHSCGRALNAPTALRCWLRHNKRFAQLLAFAPTSLSVLRPRRGTHCVRVALSVQTAATRMMTSRASRWAASPGLAGRSGPLALPLAATEARCGLSPRAFADALLVFGSPNTKDTASRQAVAGGGDLWGAEERSPGGGARSALRQHSRRGCSNGVRAARVVSSAPHPLGEHHRAVGASSARPLQCEPPPATACRAARTFAPAACQPAPIDCCGRTQARWSD